MTSATPPPWLSDLAATLTGLRTDAEIDLRVEVEGSAAYVLRCSDGAIQLVPEADPARAVILRVSAQGADRIRAGTANAQRLLADGDLTIGGRIDALQAAAPHLSGLAGSS